jgi:hypothetical protein
MALPCMDAGAEGHSWTRQSDAVHTFRGRGVEKAQSWLLALLDVAVARTSPAMLPS